MENLPNFSQVSDHAAANSWRHNFSHVRDHAAGQ